MRIKVLLPSTRLKVSLRQVEGKDEAKFVVAAMDRRSKKIRSNKPCNIN
jgi:hypothetical protein